MCGIAGLFDMRRALGDGPGTLNAMRTCLRHRGPDDAGTLWHDRDAVGLAHARLSVIDPSPAGHQPMESGSGRYAIVFNGEVYNAPALANELAAAGAKWRGHSDTEVMLAAIEAWGLDGALERFAGMFAFALHDRHERRLHLVRDRLGIKPLHYAWVGGPQSGTFAFASELKALLQVPGFTRHIDPVALSGFFAHACVPGNVSIWKDACKVPPGHVLCVDLTTGAHRLRCWWNALEMAEQGTRNPLACSDAEATERLDGLLQSVSAEHLVSDVPIGVLLSGGVDSAAVTAMAGTRTRLHAFTVGFDDARFDERAGARRTAKALGVPLMELEAHATDMLDCIPRMPQIFDEPFADSSQLATWLISRLMRQHATVALSGDGGDEVFGGYHRHVHAAGGWSRTRRVPHALRALASAGVQALSRDAWDGVFTVAAPLLPAPLRTRQAGERVHKWARMLACNDEAGAYRCVTQIFEPSNTPAHVAGAHDWWNDDAAARLPDFMRRQQFMDQTGYLVDDVLVKVDRASMACGLEVRVPLLDHRVVAFAWSLPAHMKVRNGRGKWLLRQVLGRHVPPEAMSGAKTGFAVPLEAWLRGPLREWVGDLLASARMRQDPLLDASRVQSLHDAFAQGGRVDPHQIWCLLMYRTWADHWSAAS